MREFISSEGKADVSCSAFTSQAHLNVKIRRGDTFVIKVSPAERREAPKYQTKNSFMCCDQ